MPIIFYDLETSGISQHFDQILQFAAIETDDELNEVSKIEMRSRLQAHVIPNPMALHVTGMTIERVTDPKLPSNYEMISAIRSWMSGRCPSTFVGWNSLRFDEEFLRHAFYQCLHPAYLTNTGGSGREDMLHVVRAATLVAPDLLTVPVTDAGKPTYKLDRMAPANAFENMNAHDALGDVEAMIHLCRIVRDQLPEFWAQAMRFSRKAAATDFVKTEPAFVLFEASGARPVANVVALLGCSPDQTNLHLCVDLRCDLEGMVSLDGEALAKCLKRSPQPIRKVKVNAAPVMLRIDEVPSHLVSAAEAEMLIARAAWLRSQPDLIDRLLVASRGDATTWEPSTHVEQQLYEGFWSRADAARLEHFHMVDWETRPAIADELEDHRLRRFARRIIHSERPDLLSKEIRTMMDGEIRKRRQGTGDGQEPWLTAPNAREEFLSLMTRLGSEARLGDYTQFLDT